MSYPCGYEYLLGQQQQLHNIQLIYPAAAAGEDKSKKYFNIFQDAKYLFNSLHLAFYWPFDMFMIFVKFWNFEPKNSPCLPLISEWLT